MASTFIPVEYYRTKFYQRKTSSKKFMDTTEEQIAEIAKKVYRKKELNEEGLTPQQINKTSKMDTYIKTLQYLTNPTIHMDIKTFDERLAYLIMTVDPELVTFKEFLKIHIQSIKEIENETNTKKRNRLYDERNQVLANYEAAVREKIGFFDSKLLHYEELFFKRFYNKKDLITEVRQNNEDNFFFLSTLLKSFNSISNERYQELVEIAQAWLSKVPEKYKSKIAIYSATNQKELIGIKGLAEQYVFYILVTDPNLDMLRIYEEESMIPNVEERITEAFGYYNKELLHLERLYHTRFCPDKKLSIWTDTK